jgi:nitrite reductase/ring-hydroxylating ferredoxin subunit
MVHRLHYFGRDLVAYRPSDGRVRIFDAHCPHLGANLGVGGTVVDDMIVCPFHAWRFNADGACAGIPYAERIPAQARLRDYPVQEANGFVYVYFDEAGGEPAWSIPEIEDWDDQETWTPYRELTWQIRTHVQEIAENGFDAAHQIPVHDAIGLPKVTGAPSGPVFEVDVYGEYGIGESRSQVGAMLQARLRQLGLGGFQLHTVVNQDGFELTLQTQTSFTPVDAETVHVIVDVRTRRFEDEGLTQVLSEAIASSFVEVWERDIPIWENKCYRTLPARVEAAHDQNHARLCENEADVSHFRRWCQDFY